MSHAFPLQYGISRTTFYHHFKGKYDLVSWIYEQEAEKIKSRNNEELHIFF